MADLDGTTFLNGGNAAFIAALYARFLEDPEAVDASWRSFFSELEDGAPAAEATAPAIKQAALRRATTDSIRAMQLVRAYRVRGHLEADLDPLGLDRRAPQPELDYRTYGFV